MKKVLAPFLFFLWLYHPGQLHSQEGEPRELFPKAYALFSAGNPSQAEELFLKTLDRGFPLEDYSLYFLGVISVSRGDLGSSRAYFSRLQQIFPQSVWSPRAELRLAKISLAEKDIGQALEKLLALRTRRAKREISDEALYLLAEIHEGQGKLNQAYSHYQELRHTSPLSPWAAEARKAVKKLREQYSQLFELETPEALSNEGDLLLRERQYQEAEGVYRKLLELVPQGSLRPRFLMGLANVYLRSRKREEAIPILTEIVREYPASSEAPNALYRLAWIYWNRDENLTALGHFGQLRERYPKSAFVDFAHLASARIYESLGSQAEALAIYQDFSKRFPDSKLREEAAWRLAWIHYLQPDDSRAYAAFKRLASDQEEGRYKTAALYWQARAAERIGRTDEARQILLRIINGHEDSYYTGPAARRLERMGVVEERKPANSNLPAGAISPLTPNLSFHLSRAQELAEISLSHLAVAELDEIKSLSSGDLPSMLALMREYSRNRAFSRSVSLASQIHHPSDELNRYRYPLAYWEMIQKMAKERGLDPYLILALIRQESLFDPNALSPASAYGLMQLLPSTGARAAHQLGLPSPQPERLFDPIVNLTLGTHYLKALLKLYSNNLVKAIAAYNAGESAVARWERQLAVEDEEEFIERIPYGETRLYVKLVLRNYQIYRNIYPDPKKE